jgi:UDP:flavonoid glycosyltransferase YjiC (YdhE family)
MKIGLQAWGSEGDIRPFTALAAGLTKAGHDVTLVVTDNAGRDYSGLAQRFGYGVVSPNRRKFQSTSNACMFLLYTVNCRIRNFTVF